MGFIQFELLKSIAVGFWIREWSLAGNPPVCEGIERMLIVLSPPWSKEMDGLHELCAERVRFGFSAFEHSSAQKDGLRDRAKLTII